MFAHVFLAFFLTFVRDDAAQSVLAVYSPVRTTFTLIMFPTAGVIADVIGTNECSTFVIKFPLGF